MLAAVNRALRMCSLRRRGATINNRMRTRKITVPRASLKFDKSSTHRQHTLRGNMEVWDLPSSSLLPERAWLRYVRVCCRDTFVICNVRAPILTGLIETFGRISSPFCTLAILWPPCKIFRRSAQGNAFVGGVKRKRCSKIERRWTYRNLLSSSCLFQAA